MIVVLIVITHLIEGNSFGPRIQSLTKSSKRRLAEALATFISVDIAGALVTMGEVVSYKEVHEIVSPKFDKQYTEACVIEGEDIPTLRSEQRGTQKLFVNTEKIPKGKWV